MTKRDIALVVVAAGQGQRLGAGKPKAFVDLVGRPLLTHAIESIIALPDLAQLILAVPESHLAESAQIGAELIGDLPIKFEVVLGGETRQASIANALAELGEESQIVLVHDAARALAPTSLFASVAASVRATGTSSLPVMRVVDTIKRIEGDTILETVDREVLRSAQTPQGFVAAELRAEFTEEPTNWSRRYKANLEKLASGDVVKVSEVVRDLWRRDQDRGLSAGEKRMLAKARQILVSELALARKTDEEKASAELDTVLAS